MNARRAVPAVLLLLLVPTYAEAAKPKPKVCKQVADDAGDTYLVRTASSRTYPEDALDIVSADVATSASTITAVIRLKKYATPPASSPSGATYEMQFEVSGMSGVDVFYLNASNSPGAGPTFDAGYRTNYEVTTIATSLGTPNGTFDANKNEIRISAPLSFFASQVKFKAGTKIAGIEVFTGRGGRGRGVFADDATAAKAYTHLTKTCVTVGK